MKSQKGITLASLAIYIVLVFVVLAILATVTSNMRAQVINSGKEGTGIAEINKFNISFLQEVKKPQNEIEELVTENEIAYEILFTSGNKYAFVPNKHCIYLNDKIRISENIENCEFSSSEENGKTIITVIIEPQNGQEKVIEYILGSGLFASDYENENEYIIARLPDEPEEPEGWPSGFIEVEYLESTGTQWIDTGVLARTGLSAEAKVLSPPQNTITACILGNFSVSNCRFDLITFGTKQSNKRVWGLGYTAYNYLTEYSYQTIYNVEASLKNGEQFLKVDGNSLYSNTVSGEYTSDTNLYMFARLKQGTIDSYYTGKLYYCKIWYNDTLIRDFVPCYCTTTVTNADGIECPAGTKGLYDLVEGKFYTNKGSGEFKVGPVVLPEGVYASNGLVLWLDGINNTRNGNNPNATSWEDLSGNENDGIFSSAMVANQSEITATSKGYYSIAEQGYVFLHNDAYMQTANNIGISGDATYTIEFVIKPWAAGTNSNYSAYTTSTPVWWGTSSANVGKSVIATYRRNDNKFSLDFINNNVKTDSTYNIIDTVSSLSFRKIKTGQITNGNTDAGKINYNGTLVPSTYSSAAFTQNLVDSKVTIGRDWQYNNQNRPFYGSIQSIRIYNRVLTDAEVQQNYEVDSSRFGIKNKELITTTWHPGAFTGINNTSNPPYSETSNAIRIRSDMIEVQNGLTITGSDYANGCGFCVIYYQNESDELGQYCQDWSYANPRVVEPVEGYRYVKIMAKPYSDNRQISNNMISSEAEKITIERNVN